jgi:hypothetical protein
VISDPRNYRKNHPNTSRKGEKSDNREVGDEGGLHESETAVPPNEESL